MGVYNSLVRETKCDVERLGMDENWVDVTQMVEARTGGISCNYLVINKNNPFNLLKKPFCLSIFCKIFSPGAG